MLFSTPMDNTKFGASCVFIVKIVRWDLRKIIICFHSQDYDGRVEIIIVCVVKIVCEELIELFS